ncbi:hypothetical protein EAE96_006585 [Botrytis aclada]|nr:hypothetical protein EAE96_006585 [Botrytis aclada]
MVSLKLSGTVLIAAPLGQTLAHLGEDRAREIAKRTEFLQHSKRASNCDGVLRSRGIDSKQHKRRLRALEEARAARGLPQKTDLLRRDALDESHFSSLDVTTTTPDLDSIIFGRSLLLDVEDEYIRSNITESEVGVPVIWDLEFIDINTCLPMQNLTSDIWHCNATGVYGGVVADGKGD